MKEVSVVPLPLHFQTEISSHPYSKSKQHKLYAQQTEEWFDACSWRIYLYLTLKQVSIVLPSAHPTVELRWIFTFTCAFANGEPIHFRKAHSVSYMHRNWRMIGCVFVDYRHLEGSLETGFNGTSRCPKGDFKLTSTRVLSNRDPFHFANALSLSYAHVILENDQMHICRESTFRMWPAGIISRCALSNGGCHLQRWVW